jgi:hypothetical protein
MVIGAEIEICCAPLPLDADEIFGLSKDGIFSISLLPTSKFPTTLPTAEEAF